MITSPEVNPQYIWVRGTSSNDWPTRLGLIIVQEPISNGLKVTNYERAFLEKKMIGKNDLDPQRESSNKNLIAY